ncbi:hypothetical protein U9M48_009817 [Paspalum notatum var. saurae]|uniref:F-box domain-containing protein n=1 Tax=Paspalum notatum var. saurae TaxID=547442 RepID=A0AAQ3SRZ1_PASNO
MEMEVELIIHRLPDDMVAAVLCRLSPTTLATARCVCKRWCSIVDGRCLLRARTDLLVPLRLDGIFCNCDPNNLLEPRPYFFACPSTARRIAGDLDFFLGINDHRKNADRRILDHCNGLLLLGWDMAVVNPATRQWATLPPYPEPLMSVQLSSPPAVEDEDLYPRFYLAYDPMAVSPHHFEVFLIPDLMVSYKCNYDGQSEWPPSPYTAHVFSSTTWVWEKRSFVRQGEPAVTIDDAATDDNDRHSVYFQGALYIHWQNNSENCLFVE